LIDSIMATTRHDELHHYAAVMLAASRDEALIARLFRLAEESSTRRLPHFIEAVALVPGEEKDDLLARLHDRLEW
jgi:hypothetical protein